MSEIFADSFYWIAANPADAWNQTATHFRQTSVETMLVTTDEVLIEFLNYSRLLVNESATSLPTCLKRR